MDIKTLSTIIGHVSSSTTLNIYAHVTDDAADSGSEDRPGHHRSRSAGAGRHSTKETKPQHLPGTKGQRRKPGTGCISQITDTCGKAATTRHLDGVKRPKNIYAHSKEECEALLTEMIQQTKTEIASEKERMKSQKAS